MAYRLTPPTRDYPVAERDPLWRRVDNQQGLALVRYSDDSIATVLEAPDATTSGVTTVWPGGRTYDITDEEGTLLIAAGYSDYVEVV